MAQFVHEGVMIDYTPSVDVTAGTGVLQGELFGIANIDIAANTLGALAIEGVFDIEKSTAAGSGFTVGQLVYWDNGASQATNSSGAGANQLIGKTVRTATDADTTVRVKLTP